MENALSTKLLRGEVSQGDTILVGLKGNVLTFAVKAAVGAAT